MKIFGFKSALAMLTFSAMSLFFQAPTQAQVNKQLLSDVIKSCQRDMNFDYFERMGIFDRKTYPNNYMDSLQDSCIQQRYYYLSVIEKLPWLYNSGEILPGYLASVAVANVFLAQGSVTVTEDQIIECVTKKNFDGMNECSWIWNMYSHLNQYKDSSAFYLERSFLPYVCPKCVVAHDDSSKSALKRGFVNWFLSLDKSKRRDVVSFLSSRNIWQDLQNKTGMAMRAYRDALKKIEQDDKEQRRRNLLGQ
ncbi:MAG: hypothetical protein WCP16_25220 [Pseudanabaena sp. ELA645]|jgi:hypothetical protein